MQRLVLETMQPEFDTLNSRALVLSKIWANPYLLGFLQGQVIEYIDYLGGIALGDGDKWAIFCGVVRAGAGRHGRDALAHCARLAGAGDPGHATGLQRGRALIRFRFDLDRSPGALPLLAEITGSEPAPALAKDDILRLLHHHYWERPVERIAADQA